MNTHTWPEQNSARMAVMEDESVVAVMNGVRRIDEENKDVGIRAFVWDIVDSY
jgi:hypothetical protein